MLFKPLKNLDDPRLRARLLGICVAGALAGWGLAAPGSALAGDSRVELRDGSVLTGELIDTRGGQWRFRTTTLGEISIPESAVLAMRPVPAEPEPAPAPDTAPQTHALRAPGLIGDRAPIAEGYTDQLAAIQRQLVLDPQILALIDALRGDAELQAALADPELAQRVLAGDIQSLQSDPRFLRLLEHPKIRDIVRRVATP